MWSSSACTDFFLSEDFSEIVSFIYTYVYMDGYTMFMPGACRDQEEFGPQELELQVAVSHQMRVLRMEPWSSKRAASALNP